MAPSCQHPATIQSHRRHCRGGTASVGGSDAAAPRGCLSTTNRTHIRWRTRKDNSLITVVFCVCRLCADQMLWLCFILCDALECKFFNGGKKNDLSAFLGYRHHCIVLQKYLNIYFGRVRVFWHRWCLWTITKPAVPQTTATATLRLEGLQYWILLDLVWIFEGFLCFSALLSLSTRSTHVARHSGSKEQRKQQSAVVDSLK